MEFVLIVTLAVLGHGRQELHIPVKKERDCYETAERVAKVLQETPKVLIIKMECPRAT